MASLTKYRGRWKVSVRRKGHRGIYETFDKISDARSLSYKIFLPPTKLCPRSCQIKTFCLPILGFNVNLFLYFYIFGLGLLNWWFIQSSFLRKIIIIFSFVITNTTSNFFESQLGYIWELLLNLVNLLVC